MKSEEEEKMKIFERLQLIFGEYALLVDMSNKYCLVKLVYDNLLLGFGQKYIKYRTIDLELTGKINVIG